MKKKLALTFVFAISLLFVISLNLVSGFTIQAVTPNYLNRTIPTIINFAINNTDAANITQITFTLPAEARFYGGNGTDATGTFFVNTTQGPQPVLTWTNINTVGIIQNNSNTRSFWFNATLRNLGNAFFTNITITAAHTSGGDTTNSYNYVVNFAFSGYVKNETGGNESNVNITIYKVTQGQGPPTETLEANVLSDANGAFSFGSINGSDLYYARLGEEIEKHPICAPRRRGLIGCM